MTSVRRAIELVPPTGERVEMFAGKRVIRSEQGTEDPDFLGPLLGVAIYELPWLPDGFDRSWSIVDVDAGRQIWTVDAIGDAVNRVTPVRAVRESDTIDLPVSGGPWVWGAVDNTWVWGGDENTWDWGLSVGD